MPSEPEPIIIIGAGVLGLSLAHQLLYSTPTCTTPPEQPPRRILILASSLPTDPISSVPASYASLWAGAHYRPIPASTPQLASERALALHTRSIMLQFASTFPETQTGIAAMPAEEYLEQDPDATTLSLRSGDMYAGPDDDFHVLTASELATYNSSRDTPGRNPPAKWACTYQTYCVNVTLYLQFLLSRIQARGARVVRTHVDSLRQAFDLGAKLGFGSSLSSSSSAASKTVIDCSGRGVTPDPKTNVIRGQTVLVRQQYDRTVTRQCRDGSWVFLIPRPGGGGTIVGGTKEVGTWDGEVRTGVRKELLRRAKECVPEFVAEGEEWAVVRDNVGWRPWREGGVRIEVGGVERDGHGSGETRSGRSGRSRRVIYGYGAGGRGYELSWGVAQKLSALIDENEVEKGSRAKL